MPEVRLSMRPKDKYVPGSESLKNATSSTGKPHPVVNRATTRPCASGTASGKFLKNRQDQLRCQSPTDMQKNLENMCWKHAFWIPHHKGQYRLFQTRQSLRPVSQGIRVSTGSAQRVARNQMLVASHSAVQRARDLSLPAPAKHDLHPGRNGACPLIS